MSSIPEAAQAFLRSERERQIARLQEFCAIPSVSALGAHRQDVRRAADWTADEMRRIGLEHVQILGTGGHPCVYADHLHAPGKPTALIYGHYDVQPVDPLELWTSPPFEPQIRDGKLYARGASDDKGQVFMHLAALEALLATQGGPGVNVKLLIEGEEEIGSRHLGDFVANHTELLAADLVVISDSTMIGPGRPAVCTGLRGLMAAELSVRTAQGDLHSGLFGGAVPNALHELAALIAGLHDADGRVAVPGFYDDVEPLGAEELAAAQRLADPEGFKRTAGVTGTPGEPGYSVLERIWGRPTLEVNGMWGGFTGEGPKTVIPCVAQAKLTCRLVPNQDPDAIGRAVEAKLRASAPDYVELTFRISDRSPAWSCSPDEPALAAAGAALGEAFGTPPVYARMGGSIGVVPTFARLLGAPIVMMGFALETENFHAPNEHFTLANFDLGLRALVGYWRRLGGQVGAAGVEGG